MRPFDKNMEALKKNCPYIDEIIRKILMDSVAGIVGVEQAKNGMPVLRRISEGRKWYLNSRLDPEMAATIYADRYQPQNYRTYFIFGFSDGRCIRKILQKCDDTNILMICIPDMVEFAVACDTFELSDILEDARVILYFREQSVEVESFIQHIIDFTKIKLLEFCILPGYDVIHREMCEAYMNSVIEAMRNITANRATHLTFHRSLPQGMLYNMKHLIRFSNVRQLQEQLKKLDLENVPAIIVSARPSLDKNVHLLKQAQGKAVIIVVDASIRAVMRAGVRPDLLCSVDPNSPERFFSELDLRDIYWTCCQSTNPRLIQKYAEHIFYYGSYGERWNKMLEKELGCGLLEISTGGSVSTEAFMLALYLGFRRIVLIGQDLAFTGGVSHTKGIGDALGENVDYINSRYLMEVEGIDGTILQTDYQMWFYKQWFEKVIRINQNNIRVIDATEGGARIEGTELMTLEEVIWTYCTEKFDFYGIEQNIPPMFLGDQQKRLYEEFRSMRGDIVAFQNHVTDVIGRQEKILAEIGQASAVRATKLLKQMATLNDTVDADKFAVKEYVSMYAVSEEYEVGDNIYAEKELSPQQLVERSLTLLRGYQKGAKLFLEDFEMIMKDSKC